MAVKMEIGSSVSFVSAYLSSPCQRKAKLKLTSRLGLFDGAEHWRNLKGVKSCKLIYRKPTVNEILSKRQCILCAAPEGQESYSETELDDFELEQQQPSAEDATSSDISYQQHIERAGGKPGFISYQHTERAGGKPGFISFYGHSNRSEDQILVSGPEKNKNYLLWFIGPTVLVASVFFPSLYFRRMLSTIFEDSLLTDFLILFFAEALFYFGAAVFLLLIDFLWRPMDPASAATNRKLVPLLGYRISSVAIFVLSLIIPMMTMGFVWPWIGPAAPATMAPYLVGIVVQFAFEKYARYISSPSWPVIPIIFRVYQLQQLNRAAQLVTALSSKLKGAEMTSHNLAIYGSLNTLLNVLHFLGIISIWSLSSFIVFHHKEYSSSSLKKLSNINGE